MRKGSFIFGVLGILFIIAGVITFILFNNPETIEYDGTNYYKTIYKRVDKNIINDSINYVNSTRKLTIDLVNDNEAVIIPIKDETYVDGYTFVVKYLNKRKVNYAFNGIGNDNSFILLTDITNIEDTSFNTNKSNYLEAIKKYMYKSFTKGTYNIDISIIDYYKNNKNSIMIINGEEYKVVDVIEK